MNLLPPPSAPTLPDVARESFGTNREFVEALTAPAECASCHRSMNPFGFALERYDAVGRSQTHEADTGAPINTVAEVTVDGASVTVTGPDELMGLIGASDEAQLQYVRTWLAHAYGRPIDRLDECIERQLAGRLTDADYTVLDLMVDLTQTDGFRMRALLEDGQ